METVNNQASKASVSNILKTAQGFVSDWIKATKELAADAVAFPTKIRTGDNFTLATSDSPASSLDVDNIPGVSVIRDSIFPGVSIDPSSPISIASRGIWSAIRNFITSVYKNYSNTAVIKYLTGMMSLFQYYVVGCRLYGSIRYANYINRYAGRELVEAMGFDTVNVTNESFKLRNHINNLVSKLKNLVIPKGFKEFDKSMFAYRDIYADEKDDRAQWYMYMPAFFWKLQRNAVTRQWELVKITIPDNCTVDQFIALGWDMMNAILDDEDVGIIGGDLIKAFKGELWQLAELDENYYVGIKYSKEILYKIHNTCVLDYNPNNDVVKDLVISSRLTENGDPYIYFNPYFEVDTDSAEGTHLRRMCGDRVIDFDHDPTEDEKLIALLSTYTLKEVTAAGGKSQFFFDAVGSEVVWYIRDYYYNKSGELVYTRDTTRLLITSTTSNTVTITKADFLNLKIGSKFKHYPIRTVLSNANGDTGYAGIIGELQYYTKLDSKQLQYFHQQCLLALWDIRLQEKFGR